MHDHLRFKIWDHIERARIIYSSSYFLSVSHDALLSAAELCHKTGQVFCFNLASSALVKIWSQHIQHLLPFVEYLFANEKEILQLAKVLSYPGDDVVEITQYIANLPMLGQMSRVVVVTQGSKPTLVASHWRGHSAKVHNVNKHEKKLSIKQNTLRR